MTERQFANRLRSLFNIDADQLSSFNDSEWRLFQGNPVYFYLRSSDRTRNLIWQEIEKRQPENRPVTLDENIPA